MSFFQGLYTIAVILRGARNGSYVQSSLQIPVSAVQWVVSVCMRVCFKGRCARAEEKQPHNEHVPTHFLKQPAPQRLGD